MKRYLIIIFLFLIGLNITFAQNVSQYRHEIENLINDFQTGKISTNEMESRSSIVAANINSGNIRTDARSDIEWRRQWVSLLTDIEQYLDNINKTKSVPYTLFYSNEIKQGAINYQNETIELSIETNLRANETWLLPKIHVVQSIYRGLRETERTKDWGLENWPLQGVTNLNSFGRTTTNFIIALELVNNRNIVIGRENLRVNCEWRWIYEYTNPPYIYISTNTNQLSNNNLNTVRFNVKVDNITDDLTIRITTVNGKPAETASRDGVLHITAMSGIDFENNLNAEIRFGLYSNWDNEKPTIFIIPENIWGEPVISIDRNVSANNAINLIIPKSVSSIRGSALHGNKLTSITLGANVIMGTDQYGNPSFSGQGDFARFYQINGNRAGTYTRNTNDRRDNKWSYIAFDGVVSNVPLQDENALNNLIGIWKGSYRVERPRNEVGLTLTVYKEEELYKAIFEFYSIPGRSNFANGSYYMNVFYNPVTRRYILEGYEWINQPRNFVFVDLEGTLEGNIFSGSTFYFKVVKSE